MKILIWYWGRRGGMANYSYEISKAFKEIGADVHLSLSKQSEHLQKFQELRLPTHLIDTYTNTKEFILRSTQLKSISNNLISYIEKEKIDIVYATCHNPWGGYIFRKLNKKKIYCITTVHDVTIHPGDGGFLNQLLLDAEIRNANSAVCLTNSVKKKLLSRHKFKEENTLIAPHGVFPYFHAKIPKKINHDKKIIVFFYGRISRYKGLNLLVEAWNDISKLKYNCELHIYGHGSIPQKTLESIKNSSSIHLENRWIKESENTNIFENSHICVCPYTEASQSGVIPIALSAAIPVIITPQPGLIEQIQHGGGIITSTISKEAISLAISTLIEDSTLYEKKSLEAIHSAKTLNWTSIATSIFSFLIQQAGNKNARI